MEFIRKCRNPLSGAIRKFPEGLRVLAIDESLLCLSSLEALLKECRYEVTTTPSASFALELLRRNKNKFDLVITDVEEIHEMNGFKLLQIIGLEMDMPVIMMTSRNDRKTVMQGIEHGACHILVKPPSLRDLQGIWKHVLSKKHKSTPRENNNRNEASGHSSNKQLQKQKKKRFSWADPELHAKFVEAFYKLGDQAVPSKIILEMKVPGVTREQIASHLQKYRKVLENQRPKSDNTTALNGTRGIHLQKLSFTSLNRQIQNRRNYLNDRNSHHPETSQSSRHGVTPMASNHWFVKPQAYNLPSGTQQYTSRLSSAVGMVNQNEQKMQLPDSRMQNIHNQSHAAWFNAPTFSSSSELLDMESSSSMFPDHNAYIDSRASDFQFDDLAYYPMLGGDASSSNLNSVFQNDYTYNMTNTALSGFDELSNVVAPRVPSANVMQSHGAEQMPSAETSLAVLETDNINYDLGADGDLSALIRPYCQRQ